MIEMDDRLYQWDSGHVVILSGDDAQATEVHFAQYCSRAEALVVAVRNQGGAMVADVPNAYLTGRADICAWTWADDQTISGTRFKVRERNKPADYVYTPTEVLNYEHLKQWMLDQFQQLQLDNFDYDKLHNKPRINDVELSGNKELSEIGVETISDEDIDSLFT